MPRSDDVVSTLRSFYLETIRPDMEGILRDSKAELREEIVEFRRDVDHHFDGLYHRLDRLETEYHMLVEGVRRVEQVVLGGEG